jgi:preprotein translocase subunit Sss1
VSSDTYGIFLFEEEEKWKNFCNSMKKPESSEYISEFFRNPKPMELYFLKSTWLEELWNYTKEFDKIILCGSGGLEVYNLSKELGISIEEKNLLVAPIKRKRNNKGKTLGYVNSINLIPYKGEIYTLCGKPFFEEFECAAVIDV